MTKSILQKRGTYNCYNPRRLMIINACPEYINIMLINIYNYSGGGSRVSVAGAPGQNRRQEVNLSRMRTLVHGGG